MQGVLIRQGERRGARSKLDLLGRLGGPPHKTLHN